METKTSLTRPGLHVAAPALLAALLVAGGPASAAEIRLLSAASMQTVFRQLAGEFERSSGHRLIIRYSTMGAITDRIMGGEQADLVISSPQSISDLVEEARIDSRNWVRLARTGVGIVAPSGHPNSAIASVEDLKRALLAAKTIVYADPPRGGAAGIHIAGVIEKLGIAEQLKPKTRLAAGGDVTEVTLAQGEGALGLTQISEIVGKPGAEFLGPLPDEFQNYTGFIAGIPRGVKPSEAVTALLDLLKSPAAIAVMKTKGMEVD